jgi:hypothetical protein
MTCVYHMTELTQEGCFRMSMGLATPLSKVALGAKVASWFPRSLGADEYRCHPQLQEQGQLSTSPTFPLASP